MHYRQSRNGLDDPHARCQPAGGMRFFTVPNGMEFIDQPELNRIFIIDGENRDLAQDRHGTRDGNILLKTN